jgi:aminoglycoside phosphotransferase (APT) family kinase protein
MRAASPSPTLTHDPEQQCISGETSRSTYSLTSTVSTRGAVGLLGHGPHTGYVERQTRVRQASSTQRRRARTFLTWKVAMFVLERWLPEHSELTIAHGDYRSSNCITLARIDCSGA